jgi:hypothetical protein
MKREIEGKLAASSAKLGRAAFWAFSVSRC